MVSTTRLLRQADRMPEQLLEICEPLAVVRCVCPKGDPMHFTPPLMVAGLLSSGYRLASGHNHQDVWEGLQHVSQIRHCKPEDLTRVITWRFVATAQLIGAQTMGVHEFTERWQADPAWREGIMQQPDFQEVLQVLESATTRLPLCFHLANPARHDRELIIPVKGDPEIIKRLAEDYENGF